ncbi:MAG: hypothetical protein M1827_001962 [Pycnora praestabilis]|nr:MAG: hypothetical protein M1827_001962 [Pycnora praestabilis]
MTSPIPGPPGLPLLGNLNDIDKVNVMVSMSNLADTYGPIYKLNLAGKDRLMIGNVEMLDEFTDESRFTKGLSGPLNELRAGIHDGLFTARYGEHNWEVAHRVLMPAFGPLMIREMFDEMHDVASQLVAKWARYGPDFKIDVTDDFTRLTLDSIALCAMDTRFNSYYKDDLHPFVHAMVGFLAEAGKRSNQPALQTYFQRTAQRQYDADIDFLQAVARDVVARRRQHPSDKKDLLNAMLKGRDPKTGEGLTDDSIMNNMITFLIAGHETTSGLLSFLFQYFLKNPETYQKAQKEVDDVAGKDPVTVEHMSKLPYLTACLRETLRLCPTAPAWSMTTRPEIKEPITICGGKYEIQPGQTMTMLLSKVHRDPAVYGNDAEAFRPERMLDENFNKLPKNAWKPFGNGVRACIGRPFAWQEALLTTALLLQKFNFRLDDPSYQLKIRQTLTIKPKDFFMHATLRDGVDVVHLEKSLHADPDHEEKASSNRKEAKKLQTTGKPKKPMSIFYGSNTGTCEALAQGLATTAASRDYDATVASLDSATDKLPKDQPVVIVTASYEGQPPDNAGHFIEWLKNLEGTTLQGVNYVVFGCGHRDWQATFQRVPKLTDALLEERGAKRIAIRGYADAAAGDMFNDFDKWEDETFWPGIADTFGSTGEVSEETSGLDVEVSTQLRTSDLRHDVRDAVVQETKVLTPDEVPPKRHMQLKLPTDMNYKAGDYLAVLPINNSTTIRRVIKRFGLPWDAMVTIRSQRSTTLPTDRAMSVFTVLGAYVELNQPATLKNVNAISKSVTESSEKEELQHLASDAFTAEITAKRISPLDLLERFPSATLPLGEFLGMLPPLRIRQYSISSSPLVDADSCTITWSVLDQKSLAGSEKRYLGAASNYLSHLEKGEHVQVSVRASQQAFHPPLDSENIPLVMICAGTGIAPFRGFVQERAQQIEAGRKLATALLFIGCHSPTIDKLYSDEFSQWEKLGAVKTRYAYSRKPEDSKGCRYVQERLWEDREEVVELFNQGARIYVCGSSAVGTGVQDMTKKMYKQANEQAGKMKTDEEIEKWFVGIKNERYASDVFA